MEDDQSYSSYTRKPDLLWGVDVPKHDEVFQPDFVSLDAQLLPGSISLHAQLSEPVSVDDGQLSGCVSLDAQPPELPTANIFELQDHDEDCDQAQQWQGVEDSFELRGNASDIFNSHSASGPSSPVILRPPTIPSSSAINGKRKNTTSQAFDANTEKDVIRQISNDLLNNRIVEFVKNNGLKWAALAGELGAPGDAVRKALQGRYKMILKMAQEKVPIEKEKLLQALDWCWKTHQKNGSWPFPKGFWVALANPLVKEYPNVNGHADDIKNCFHSPKFKNLLREAGYEVKKSNTGNSFLLTRCGSWPVASLALPHEPKRRHIASAVEHRTFQPQPQQVQVQPQQVQVQHQPQPQPQPQPQQDWQTRPQPYQQLNHQVYPKQYQPQPLHNREKQLMAENQMLKMRLQQLELQQQSVRLPFQQPIQILMQQPTQPMQQPTQPMQQPTQPMQQPTQPMQQPTQPMQQPTQPMQQQIFHDQQQIFHDQQQIFQSDQQADHQQNDATGDNFFHLDNQSMGGVDSFDEAQDLFGLKSAWVDGNTFSNDRENDYVAWDLPEYHGLGEFGATTFLPWFLEGQDNINAMGPLSMLPLPESQLE